MSVCEAFKTLYMIEVSGDFYQIALGSSSEGRASVHRIEGHGFKSHLPETNLRISSFFLSPLINDYGFNPWGIFFVPENQRGQILIYDD